jgi:hypothetical protein
MALIFREKVFAMLQDAHFLSTEFADRMRTWHHSGFSVHQSFTLSPDDNEGIQRLARYIARAPVAQKKLEYLPKKGKVTYSSKHETRLFGPLEFIFLLQKHIPNKGEVLIRYYGYYANAARGKRKKDDEKAGKIHDTVTIETQDRKICSQSWARLIKKVYEVDPLLCPNCGEKMRIIAFIDQWKTIVHILTHLKLWPPESRPRPPPILATLESHDQSRDLLSQLDLDLFSA